VCVLGVSEEAALHLFNPFQQAQRLAGGTGTNYIILLYLVCCHIM